MPPAVSGPLLRGLDPVPAAQAADMRATFGLPSAIGPFNPQPAVPTRDTIRATIYPQPYYGPGQLDNYGRETSEMRRAYRDLFAKEPAVSSAVEGAVAAIAGLDVSVVPRDEHDDDDCEAAEFLDWAVSKSEHGWDGLIRNMLIAALIDGFSLGEIVLREGFSDRVWGACWPLKHVRPIDTAHIRLQLDVFRNVTGVVSTIRGLETFAPDKCVLFTNAELFANPFGRSRLRAAYRAANIIEAAEKLWFTLLNTTSAPFLVAKREADNRAGFEQMLQQARAGGYAIIGAKDELEVINLATATSYSAFEAKARYQREQIYLAVRGAYLPFMQGAGSKGDPTGNTETSKGTGSDPREYLDAKAVARTLNRQLAPVLLTPFGRGEATIEFGGVNWKETGEQLDAGKKLQDLGLPLSKRQLYKVGQFKPPDDPGDTLAPPTAAQPGAGQFDPFAPPPKAPPAGGPADATFRGGPGPRPVPGRYQPAVPAPGAAG